MNRHSATIPLWVVDGEANGPDGEIEVEFDWTPGGFHDGDDEFTIRAAYYVLEGGKLMSCGLAEHEVDRVTDWLDGEWERPDEQRERAA
jgi:hypothetical protein